MQPLLGWSSNSTQKHYPGVGKRMQITADSLETVWWGKRKLILQVWAGRLALAPFVGEKASEGIWNRGAGHQWCLPFHANCACDAELGGTLGANFFGRCHKLAPHPLRVTTPIFFICLVCCSAFCCLLCFSAFCSLFHAPCLLCFLPCAPCAVFLCLLLLVLSASCPLPDLPQLS